MILDRYQSLPECLFDDPPSVGTSPSNPNGRCQNTGTGDTQSNGFIAAYDLATGKLDGLLQDASGKPLAVNGIWSLSSGVEIFGLIGVPGGIRTLVCAVKAT